MDCFRYIVFEGAIHRMDGGRGLLLDAQVIPHKAADIVAGAGFDFGPVVLIQLVLHLRRLPHQHIIADLITLGEREASGVQAFENQLGIVAGFQRDADDLQMAEGIEQLVHRNLLPQQQVTEKLVVVCQVGRWVVILGIAEQPLEGIAVSLDRTQTDLILIGGPARGQKAVIDLLVQSHISFGCENALAHEIAHGQQQERHGGQPLLTVDHMVFHLAAVSDNG